MFSDMAKNDVFHNLTAYACEGDGSIVGRIRFRSLFVDAGNNCSFPLSRNDARIV